MSRLKSRFGVRISKPNSVNSFIIERKLKRILKEELNVRRCVEHLNSYLKIPLDLEEFKYKFRHKVQSEKNVQDLLLAYEEEGELGLVSKMWKLHGIKYQNVG